MDEMNTVAQISGAALSGGITGILGSIGGRVLGLVERRMARKDRELEMIHEEKQWKQEATLLELQHRLGLEEREQLAQHAVELTNVQGSWDGLIASQDAEKAIGESYPWVNAVRALTRPGLTIFLSVAVFIIYFVATEDQQLSIVNALIYGATTATLWWFGDRAPQHFGKPDTSQVKR